jgi:hypothetical protein
MSGMRHPTISAWQRQEDGGYAAELDGWSLRVAWHAESKDGRGFSWVVERDGERLRSEEIYEEIEVAMGAAEARIDAGEGVEDPPAPEADVGAGHH